MELLIRVAFPGSIFAACADEIVGRKWSRWNSPLHFMS